MSKTFNIYCDESSHLQNDGHRYMLISYISCPYPQIREHKKFIEGLKAKYAFKGEIKWVGISEKMSSFYIELVEYFFATDLRFRSVIVEKAQIKADIQKLTYDDFYFEMYHELICHKLVPEYTYNIYLDIKDTRSQKKLKILDERLNINKNIRQIRFIKSHESYLMQLADVIMGAINYHLRGLGKVSAKNKLIETILHHSKLDFTQSTPKAADKFNLYHLDLQ